MHPRHFKTIRQPIKLYSYNKNCKNEMPRHPWPNIKSHSRHYKVVKQNFIIIYISYTYEQSRGEYVIIVKVKIGKH